MYVYSQITYRSGNASSDLRIPAEVRSGLEERSGQVHLKMGEIPWFFSPNWDMGLSENSVPLHPVVNDHYPY